MSVARILNIAALSIFVIFVATFFTVLVRMSQIGPMPERLAFIGSEKEISEEPSVKTWFELIGQENDTGRLTFNIRARIDTSIQPFNNLKKNSPIILRVENLLPEYRQMFDIEGIFNNPANDRYVICNFGTISWEVPDRRDLYPFDKYLFSMNFAYFIPDETGNSGTWYEPESIVLKSLTGLRIFNPRYVGILPGVDGFRADFGRLRMLQFLSISILLIEILFLLYLMTILDLQILLGKGLGNIVVLYIIRNILTSGAPQFPNLVDYMTLFIICAIFFLMLFRFLGNSEEYQLLSLTKDQHPSQQNIKEVKDENTNTITEHD